MGLPHTLAGLVGFMIFVTVLSSWIYMDVNPDSAVAKGYGNTKQFQDDVVSSISGSLNASGTLLGVIEVGTQIITLPITIMSYVTTFTVVTLELPEQARLLVMIILICLVIALYKAIRGVDF